MPSGVTVLAVIGRKNSGKTTVIEGLISELAKRHLRVASVKHIRKKGFSMDREGKDTWRHSAAGANPVIAVSDIELIIKMKGGLDQFSLDRMINVAQENQADVLVLEGFSSLVAENERVGKIVCVRDLEEYEEFRKSTRGEVLAFLSFQPLGEPVLNINADHPFTVERVTRFIEERERISEILGQLAGLDCGKCGRATCEELAEDIHQGQASLDDCVPFKFRSEVKARIMIGESEIPIQPFVSEIIRKAVLGMVSTLKAVDIEGAEKVDIVISRSELRARSRHQS